MILGAGVVSYLILQSHPVPQPPYTPPVSVSELEGIEKFSSLMIIISKS